MVPGVFNAQADPCIECFEDGCSVASVVVVSCDKTKGSVLREGVNVTKDKFVCVL